MTPEEELLLLQQISSASGNGAGTDVTTLPIGSFEMPPQDPTMLDKAADVYGGYSGAFDAGMKTLSDTKRERGLLGVGDEIGTAMKGQLTMPWLNSLGEVASGGLDVVVDELGGEKGTAIQQSIYDKVGAVANQIGDTEFNTGELSEESVMQNLRAAGDKASNLLQGAQDYVANESLPALSATMYGGDPYALALGGEGKPSAAPATAPANTAPLLDQAQANAAADAEINRSVLSITDEIAKDYTGDSVGDNKKKDDDIWGMLKSTAGDAFSLSRDAWGGLSTSTKIGIIGSALTLYMKSQGWKNSAATGAQMTAQGYMSALGQQDQLASGERIAGARDKATVQSAAIKAQQAATKAAQDKETLSKVADIKDLREVISPALDNSDLFKGDWNPTTNEEAMKADMVNQVGALYAKQFPYIEDQRQNPMTPDLARNLAAQIQAQKGTK